ncbi:MAG: acetyl-CoA carboxylase biotin carboxyl carrier protein subunit [Chloroflexota bacterium]
MADFFYELDTESKVHVNVEPTSTGYQVTIGEHTYHVEATMIGTNQLNLLIGAQGQQTFQQTFIATKTLAGQKEMDVWMDGQTWRLHPTDNRRQRSGGTAAQSSGTITAAMPGQVQSLLVEEGSTVSNGETLLILEAMKMETKLTAPQDGQVTKINCAVGDVVERGQLLIEIK